jgi:MYXO-CTERM domain-containing protein
MKRLAFLAVVASLCGCALAGTVRADYLVNVDFNQNGGPSGTYTGAAVLGQAGDIWNGVGGNIGDTAPRDGLSLVTSSGAASGVTLSCSGQQGFVDATGSGAVFQGTPYQALMDDLLVAFQTATVSFSGLTPGGTYRLILYSASGDTNQDTLFTVNGLSPDVGRSSSTTLQKGQNYADFTTTADGSGTLSFTFQPGPVENLEGDLNGIQLQSVASTTATPEPASLTLAGIGAVGLAGYGWRRRRRAAV